MERFSENYTLIENILANKQKVQLKVRGVSMYPFLFSGDVVTLAPVESSPREGDIYLVKLKGQYRLHRCMRVKNMNITKGDNLKYCDSIPDEWLGQLVSRKKTISSVSKRIIYTFLKYVKAALTK